MGGYLLNELNKLIRNAIKPFKGTIGEFSAHASLVMQGEQNVFRDLYIPTKNGNYSQVDLLVVTMNGIVVIESKNYSGWVFGNLNQQQWTQTFPNGKKYRFYNPIKQNQGHIYAVSSFLQIKGEDLFQSCILFSPQCELKDIPTNVKNVTIIQNTEIKSYMDYVHRQLPPCFSPQEVTDMIQKLQGCKKAPSDVKKSHKEYVKSVQNDRKENTSHQKLEMYVMAAQQNRPELGAWCVVFVEGAKVWQIQGQIAPPTVNIRNYLRGLLEGLKKINGTPDITIYSDSKYLIDNIPRVARWKNNGWKLADGNPPKNADLWGEILGYLEKYQVKAQVIENNNRYGKMGLDSAKRVLKKSE